MSRGEIIWLSSAIVGFLGLCTAIFNSIYQMRQMNRQMKLQMFSEYTKRIQAIIINLPEPVNNPDFNLSDLGDEKRDAALKYFRVYFNLCSEEYYLYKEGKVDKNIWRTWSQGIESFIRKRAFLDAWKMISTDTQYYGNFKKWVDEKVSVIG